MNAINLEDTILTLLLEEYSKDGLAKNVSLDKTFYDFYAVTSQDVKSALKNLESKGYIKVIPMLGRDSFKLTDFGISTLQ